MTDHSIPTTRTPELPFKKAASVVTDILRAVFVELPNAFASAMRARRIYDDLSLLDSAGLAALGIERHNVGRYVIERSGLIIRDDQ